MSTLIGVRKSRVREEERFFFVMACITSAVVIAGFSFQLAMGRSTFALPLVYHIHAFIFFGWVFLYLAQNWLVASGGVALHRRLGWLAAIWAPLIIFMGMAITITSMKRNGAPFFFDQNVFFINNMLTPLLFGALVLAAIVNRRRTAWHRRLLFMAMTILTGPALGRLLPLPLFIPHAMGVTVAATMLWPAIGIIADYRRSGRIHPAWICGIAAVLVNQAIIEIVANTPWAMQATRALVAGTPGANRPMQAYLP